MAVNQEAMESAKGAFAGKRYRAWLRRLKGVGAGANNDRIANKSFVCVKTVADYGVIVLFFVSNAIILLLLFDRSELHAFSFWRYKEVISDVVAPKLLISRDLP